MMRSLRLSLLVAPIVALLAGCAGTTNPPAPVPNPTTAGDAALSSTASGQNVIAWINGLNTNLASVAKTADGVIAASQPALQNMLALGNSLYTAYQLAAPALGASAADNQQASAALATLNALASGKATDVGSALAVAASATATLKQALATVAPQAAAAASAVPAAS